MTQILNDNVQVELTIDGDPWWVREAEVELSRMDTPNYVDLTMVPDPDDTAPGLPDNIQQLLGADFRLEADNALISERDTNASEDNLLFAGNLANISPTGENFYEGIAYDPAQQAFEPAGEGSGGSLMNQYIYLGPAEYEFPIMWGPDGGTTYRAQTIKAGDLAIEIAERLDIEEYELEFEEEGVTVTGEEGEYTGAFDRTLWFSDYFITVKEALTKLREYCEVVWWFDKEGVFHIGVPRPTRHELKYITEATAGKTTPPYQSVRVVGSGSASTEGFSRTNMEIENKITIAAEMALNEDGDVIPNFVQPDDATEPVFEYHNLEVSTYKQARSVARKLIEDLGEHQAEGTVEVVGFPEVVPMDGIVMPAGEDGDYPDDDIRNDQPMGGLGYGVYKVKHRLNDSDGFKTIIHVAGVTGVTLTEVSSRQAETSYDINEIPAGYRGLIED